MVEDHAIVRDGVCMLLAREPDITVVGSAASGEEAIDLLRRTRPDVVVMDVGLPGMSGIETTRRVREESPDVKVLALTVFSDAQYLLGMLDAGASGYLLKQSLVNNLVQAIRTVAVGQSFLDPSATKAVIESSRRSGERSGQPYELSDRERGILKLIADGFTSKQIGRELSLSPKTVENYRARILSKLQVKNCSEAISSAIRLGIIGPLSQRG